MWGVAHLCGTKSISGFLLLRVWFLLSLISNVARLDLYSGGFILLFGPCETVPAVQEVSYAMIFVPPC